MLKQANKWIRDSFKPYKYDDQVTRDKRQLIDGVVDTVVGGINLIFQLINLMLIVPIKALVQDPKHFTTAYREIGTGDISKIVPTFRQFVTGVVMTLTSPLLPLRMLIRWFLTPAAGVSVFANKGLKAVVDQYFQDNKEPSTDTMGMFSAQKIDDMPDRIVEKAKKYTKNSQRDSDKLNSILSKPTLTYYKMKEIKEIIENKDNTSALRAVKPA